MKLHAFVSRARIACLLAMTASLIFPPSMVLGAVKLDGFTTTPGWVDDETGNEVLTSITIGATNYVNPQFASTTATDPGGGIWLWGNAGSDPGDFITAMTDNRLDSGVLNFGNGIDFDFSSTLTANDQIFVFWNGPDGTGFYDQPTSVSAFDSGGSQVGSAVTLPTLIGGTDDIGRFDSIRSNAAPLDDRALYGIAINPSEFGGTIADITTINFTATGNGLDMQMVGFASEAAAFAEWAASGGGSWNTGSNWNTGAVPGGIPTIFGSAITSNSTVTLDGDQTVTELTFNDNNSYTLSGSKLSVLGDVSTLQGTHTIASDFEFPGGPRTLTSSAGANLNITGTTTGLNDAAGTIILDGAGGGSIGAIRDNNNLANVLDGTDNINVVKRGSGTWTIGSGTTVAEDFHGGNTTIEAGTLRVNGTGSDGELRSPTITVNSGATLDTSEFGQYTLQVDQRLEGAGTVNTGSGDLRVSGAATVAPGDNGIGTLNVTGDLTLAGGLGGNQGSLIFELSETSGGANDQIAVSGDVTSSSSGSATTVSVVPTGASLDSSYELITFGGSYTGNVATDFTVDNTLQTRFTQTISADSNSIDLDITGTNANLTWAGAPGDNNWRVNDASADSWTGGGADNRFYDLDTVNFTDSAAEKTVNVDDTVSPAIMTVNNSSGNDYTFSGSGSIAGPGSVVKTGAGRATIMTANSYSGTTTVSGGVLHAATDDALGSTAGGTTVNSGGTLEITNSNIAGETVSIQGAGGDGRGALITDGLDSLVGTQQISDVVMTGDATIGAFSDEAPDANFNTADYGWTLNGENVAGATWQGNGHTLTKKGRGAIGIDNVGELNNPTINIERGTLTWSGSTTSTNSTVTVGNGTDPISDTASGSATLNTFYGNNPGPASQSVNLVLQGGTYGHSTSAFGDLTLNGSIVNNDVTGNDDIDNSISNFSGNGNIGTLTIPTGITGNGDLRFAGNAPLVLEGNNTYTGRTEVTGDIRLGASGQLSGTSRISVIGSAASLDVTASGGLTASGGQDVSIEAGEFRGNLTIGAGSTLTGQSAVADNRAPLLTGNVVVQSGGTLELNTGQGTPLAGTDAFIQDNNTIGTGFRYIAFEAENPTTYNDNSTFNWDTVTDAGALPSTNPAGNSIRAQGDLDNGFTTGNDDTIQYDLVFTEPGTYTWYARARGENGGADSFFGPSQDANTVNPSVGPEGGMSRYLGFTFGSGNSVQGDTLKDAEGTNGTTVDYDWVRSDRTGDATVDFEEIVVTAADVAAGRVFSIAFEPRQIGARFDKMALVATDEFVGLTDGDLDGVAENATQFFTPPTPDLAFIIDGDLTLQASSTMEVDIRSLLDFDNADVTGTADLAGTLSVNLDSFTPDLNDTFDILTADTLIDSGITLGGPDGSAFSLSTASNTLTLTFTGLVSDPGDFNNDGNVDGADFLFWQRNPGVGNLADWQNSFGSPLSAVSSGSVVPEPTSLMLLSIAGLGLLCRKRN